MVRTEQESDSRRREERWQTIWCCRDQQRACRMTQASAEKLEHTEPAEKKRVASVLPRESSWQERRSRSCQKEMEQSRLSKLPDHEGERVKVGESRTLARKKGIRAKARRGKDGLHVEGRQLPRRKGKASEKSLPRTSRRKHER